MLGQHGVKRAPIVHLVEQLAIEREARRAENGKLLAIKLGIVDQRQCGLIVGKAAIDQKSRK